MQHCQVLLRVKAWTFAHDHMTLSFRLKSNHPYVLLMAVWSTTLVWMAARDCPSLLLIAWGRTLSCVWCQRIRCFMKLPQTGISALWSATDTCHMPSDGHIAWFLLFLVCSRFAGWLHWLLKSEEHILVSVTLVFCSTCPCCSVGYILFWTRCFRVQNI